MRLPAQASVVLLAHAHPDDETIATGALISELVDRGARVVLLTASRGERGEIVPAVRQLIADDEDALTAARERELQQALTVLGVSDSYMLGTPPARAAGKAPRRYRDSGMRWVRPGLAGPADDVPPDALSVADFDEVVADVRALIDTVGPGLVVSYDDNGGYGHPDHHRIREAAMAAAADAAVPFAELATSPAPDVAWFDLERHLPTVQDALRRHASQLTVDGTHIIHSGGQREPIVTSVGLRLLTG
jgi:N-acetyl-1-D-myo-inositol-2-amino-2-deoxy-alpha-D-glucopyranoside deacetylase